MRLIYLTSIFIAASLFQSCRLIKYSAAEKIKTNEGCENIQLENNRVIIRAVLEGEDRRFALDMGASTSVIFDTTAVPHYYDRKKAAFGSAKGADRKKISLQRLPLSLSNGLHETSNKVFAVLPKSPIADQGNCAPSAAFVGLYGYDLMSNSNMAYQLNFEEGRLCNLLPAQVSDLVNEGYEEIKAKIGDDYITIYVTINGVEYAFKFDTGYTGCFTMPANDQLSFFRSPHVTAEGVQAQTASGAVSSTDSYYEQQVMMGVQGYGSNITVSNSIKAQNVGMGFLKGFHWVIDPSKKKVYMKRNGLQLDQKLRFVHPYYAHVVGGKLQVRLRHIGSTDYNVGDEIISVNKQSVEDYNRCQLLKLLNESPDWKKLQVEVRKTN